MITVIIPKRGARIYSTHWTNECSIYELLIRPEDTIVHHFYIKDSLKQGVCFDNYGNKSVVHTKLTGKVNLATYASHLRPKYIGPSPNYYGIAHYVSGKGRVIALPCPSHTPPNNKKYYGEVYSVSPTHYYVRGNDPRRKRFNFMSDWTFCSMDVDSMTAEYIHHEIEYDTFGKRDNTYHKTINLRDMGICNDDPGVLLHRFLSDIGMIDIPTINTAPSITSKVYQDIMDQVLIPKVNNLENLSCLKNMKQMIPPLKKLITKHNLKSVADLYLWYKYSYKTTELDIGEYFRYLKSIVLATGDEYQKISSTVHDSDLPYQKVTRYHCYFKTYSSSILEKLGLTINMANLWDMLPLSFVLDWFISLGDTLSYLDNHSFISKMDMLSCYCTVKVIVYIAQLYPNLPELSALGLKYSYFSREHLSSLPTVTPIVSLKNPSNHMIDGAALVISNKK